MFLHFNSPSEEKEFLCKVCNTVYPTLYKLTKHKKKDNCRNPDEKRGRKRKEHPTPETN